MSTYSLYTDGFGNSFLTLIHNDKVHTVTHEHPNFAEARDAVIFDGDYDEAVRLIDIEAVARERFALSDRVSVEDGVVYFDGDPVNTTLTDQIVRFLRDKLPVGPLVKFWENLAANPSEHSREQLYDWLSRRDFTITEDGCFLAYKGVRPDLTSISAGPAFVDGKAVNGHVPNGVGSIVTVARSYVHADSAVGCSTGLHAGTWDYASTFGPVVLLVKVNPRDVVSVPTDCDAQKLRTCRYEVLEVIENPLAEALWNYDEDDDYEETQQAYGNVVERDCLGRPMPKRDSAGRFVKAT